MGLSTIRRPKSVDIQINQATDYVENITINTTNFAQVGRTLGLTALSPAAVLADQAIVCEVWVIRDDGLEPSSTNGRFWINALYQSFTISQCGFDQLFISAVSIAIGANIIAPFSTYLGTVVGGSVNSTVAGSIAAKLSTKIGSNYLAQFQQAIIGANSSQIANAAMYAGVGFNGGSLLTQPDQDDTTLNSNIRTTISIGPAKTQAHSQTGGYGNFGVPSTAQTIVPGTQPGQYNQIQLAINTFFGTAGTEYPIKILHARYKAKINAS